MTRCPLQSSHLIGAAVLINRLVNQEAEVQDEYEKAMRPAHGAEFIVGGHGMQEEGAAATTTDDHGTAAPTASAAGETFHYVYRGTVDD
jgi:hypothetical protein